MKIIIVGQGHWGQALHSVLANAGKNVLAHSRKNPLTSAQFNAANYILLTTPAQELGAYLNELKPLLPLSATYVICAKGIDLKTHLLLSDVVKNQLSPTTPIAILSGPNFAHEIAAGLPAAATLAATHNAQKIADDLGTSHFRLYASDDIIGVQIGGALKNVVALACGMVIGAGLGENARAAVMTRGLDEMVRLTENFGGKRATLMGMCGFGDLVLSASSTSSRNYDLGYRIGRNGLAAPILSTNTSLTEGVATARAVTDIATQNNLDLPVFQAVNNVLNHGQTVMDMAKTLMQRPQKPELA